MIRVDALWLSVEALDMRAGMETILARVVQVFGVAKPHHAYARLFVQSVAATTEKTSQDDLKNVMSAPIIGTRAL